MYTYTSSQGTHHASPAPRPRPQSRQSDRSWVSLRVSVSLSWVDGRGSPRALQPVAWQGGVAATPTPPATTARASARAAACWSCAQRAGAADRTRRDKEARRPLRAAGPLLPAASAWPPLVTAPCASGARRCSPWRTWRVPPTWPRSPPVCPRLHGVGVPVRAFLHSCPMTKHRVSLTVYRSRVLRHRGNLPDQPHARVRPLKKSTGPRAGAGLCGGRRERDGWTGRQTMCTSSMCVRVTERECECVCLCVHACMRQLCSGLVDRPQAREKLALETGTRASRIPGHQNLAGPPLERLDHLN